MDRHFEGECLFDLVRLVGSVNYTQEYFTHIGISTVIGRIATIYRWSITDSL